MRAFLDRSAMARMRAHCADVRAAAAASDAGGSSIRLRRLVAAPASPLLSPPPLALAPNDTADAASRLRRHVVWHGHVLAVRVLDLTVLTSFVAKDAEFASAWLEDIGAYPMPRLILC